VRHRQGGFAFRALLVGMGEEIHGKDNNAGDGQGQG